MEISYVKATKKDVKVIISIQHKLNEMLNLEYVKEETFWQYFEEMLKEDIQNETTIYYLAKNEDKIVGCVCVELYEDELISEVGTFNYAIPLIFVDERYRNGKIAFNLFKFAIYEIKRRGFNALTISVEDNNPNKYWHFAIADILLDKREEKLINGETTTQFILGVTDIIRFTNLSMKELMNRAVKVKRNFNKVVENLKVTKSNIDIQI